jgi:hypothetical protein
MINTSSSTLEAMLNTYKAFKKSNTSSGSSRTQRHEEIVSSLGYLHALDNPNVDPKGAPERSGVKGSLGRILKTHQNYLISGGCATKPS